MKEASGALLQRLQKRVSSRTESLWLEQAHVQRASDGHSILCVNGQFQKNWLEARYLQEIRDVLGEDVEIACPAARAPLARRRMSAPPRLHGPAGQFAIRAVRGFVAGNLKQSNLLVIYGPRGCGSSALLDWAAVLGGARRALRLDLDMVRAGRSRGFLPRKPLVIIDGVERLASRDVAQRTLCTILDEVATRGRQLLVAVEDHPGARSDLGPALANRLLGGILVPLQLPPAVHIGSPDAITVTGPQPFDALIQAAARLFEVDGALIAAGAKKRSVVAARRAAMTAACRAGCDEEEIARHFGLRSRRAVREAVRWIEREEKRDDTVPCVMAELGRVLPDP